MANLDGAEAERNRLRAEIKRLSAEYDAAMELLRVTREARDELAGKLARAPIAVMDTRDALSLCAPTDGEFKALYALQGHRVALVDLVKS